MKALALSLAALLLAGQIPASPPSGAMQQAPPRGIPAEEQAAQAPKLHVVAVHATGDGTAREPLEEGLSASGLVRKALEALPFDRYEAVTDEEVEAPMGKDAPVPLNGIYSLHVTPTGPGEGGALALDARVEMLDPASAEDRYVNAIVTKAQLASGMPLIFRGLDLNVGELVVVLGLAGDENQQGEGQSGQQNPDQQQDDDDKHGDQEQQGEQPQEPQEPQEQEQQSRAPEEQEEETPDLQNIEALLQSLEERDREEQEDQQKVRSGIRVRGDWW